MKDKNPYALYIGKNYDQLNRIATAAITKGIKDGSINLENLRCNPILETYSGVGANDTETREIIAKILSPSVKVIKSIKKSISQTTMEQFLSKIDFKLLKQQKNTLLNIKPDTQKDLNALEGILYLIDMIQDIAVDEYGYDKQKVFKTSKK